MSFEGGRVSLGTNQAYEILNLILEYEFLVKEVFERIK